jgi:hypothetical protein
MAFLFRLFSTLLAFFTVMLTASLIVMCLVRILHYLSNTRAKTLGEMLGALNQGFRSTQGDTTQPGDLAQSNFVLDILTYPLLHSPDVAQKLVPKQNRADAITRSRERLAATVEYLAKDDLKRIVQALSREQWTAPSSDAPVTAPAGTPERAPSAAGDMASAAPATSVAVATLSTVSGPSASATVPRPLASGDPFIPARWVVRLTENRRHESDFLAYIDAWYQRLERGSTEQFKNKARRLTATLSCLIVVFLNMDGFRLATDIFKSAAAQDILALQASTVLQTADRLRVNEPSGGLITSDRDALLDGVPSTLNQLNGVLNEPELQLGWENSWIVKKWCACAKGEASCGSPFLDYVRWLAGLAFSTLLLSLGAPFWADQLRRLLNLQNSVQAPKFPSHDGDTPSAAPKGITAAKS